MRYTFSETSYVYLYKKLVEFGKGKAIASDTRYRAGHKYAGEGEFRYLTFPGQEYMQDKGRRLPKGKRWVLTEDKQFIPFAHSPIKVADPAVLRAILATAKAKRPAGVYDGTRTTMYEGAITFGQLYKASPGTSKPKDPQAKITWRIWLGRDQLTRRVWSTWRSRSPLSGSREPTEVHVMDALFSDWGTKTQINRPAADEVITSEELHKLIGD
ncbi:hypothetical protein ACIBEJ_20000 [Nonomuraea sp. NPDC050790]|uniref:hypothetical protein n=1 Tax=Nonomuraea sp. NPDC050790 TaxID=3364371 RepID=UPI003787F9E9